MRKTEEEVGDDGGDDEKEGGVGEGGEGGDGEEGGESLEDVVARWEATLGPKYKIIVSTSIAFLPPEKGLPLNLKLNHCRYVY